MFLVSIMFFLNTLSSYGKVDSKESTLWCLVLGSIMLFLVIWGIVTSLFAEQTFWWAAQAFLFALTYFMMGLNAVSGRDQRGLGWFCLFVAVIVPLLTYQAVLTGDMRMVAIWVAWGVTWFVFFLELGLGKVAIDRWFRHVQWLVLVFTLIIPGLMILNGWW
jgi:hypothetical protein